MSISDQQHLFYLFTRNALQNKYMKSLKYFSFLQLYWEANKISKLYSKKTNKKY